MDSELQKIHNLIVFIEDLKSKGATEDKLEKHYDDLQSLQSNHYIGTLFGEDDE